MQLTAQCIDPVTRGKVSDLLADRDDPCVSLFMPTERRGAETQQNAIRFKNLVREADRQLTAWGLDRKGREALLEPCIARESDAGFWQTQGEGLAVFVAPGFAREFRLPRRTEEMVLVGNHFHVRPLLPLVAEGTRFHILALSRGEVQVLLATREAVGEVTWPKIPHSLKEITESYETEKSLQFHSGTQPGGNRGKRHGMYHGHGDTGDESVTKERMREFLRAVDRGVDDRLRTDPTPLVLAGLSENLAIFREVTQSHLLTEQDIDGDPTNLSPEEIHRRGWEIVAPIFQRQREEGVAKFRQLEGKGDPRAVRDLEALIPAARHCRVEDLFLRRGEHRWGIVNEASDTLVIKGQREDGDEDLLEVAAEHTIRGGGRVHALEEEEAPGLGIVAAVLRH